MAVAQGLNFGETRRRRPWLTHITTIYLIRYSPDGLEATAPEKPLHWVGSSKKDLLTFPEQVVDDFGYALGVVQRAASRLRPSPGRARGPEYSSWSRTGAATRGGWRTRCGSRRRYTCCIAFRRSRLRARTAKTDVDLIRERLKTAREDYEVRYGKKT